MTLALETRPDGTVLPVHVRAGGRRNAVLGERNGALRVEVTAAPERGKANRAVIDLLAETLDVAKSTIAIVSGASSNQKKVLVRSLDPATLAKRLVQATKL